MTRHLSNSLQPSSFEREALAIMLEEPALVREYRDRIPVERFRNDAYARVYAELLANADRISQTADVFTLFADDNDSVGVLTSLGRRDRSSIVRYEDSTQRRAHLERVVERLQLDDAKRRYQELSRQIDELLMAGQNISSDLRDEFDALVAKLKK
jgi:replicative DNA helicase